MQGQRFKTNLTRFTPHLLIYMQASGCPTLPVQSIMQQQQRLSTRLFPPCATFSSRERGLTVAQHELEGTGEEGEGHTGKTERGSRTCSRSNHKFNSSRTRARIRIGMNMSGGNARMNKHTNTSIYWKTTRTPPPPTRLPPYRTRHRQAPPVLNGPRPSSSRRWRHRVRCRPGMQRRSGLWRCLRRRW